MAGLISHNKTDTGLPGAILIVEDEADEVALIRHALARMGLVNPTPWVSSVAEMIAFLQGTPPYEDRIAYPRPVMILLDLQMPGMDGFSGLEWLRAHPECAAPPCIITGAKNPSALAQAYQLGARSFFRKPLDESDFLTTVKTIGIPLTFKSPPPPADL